jgi:hypothetical protein
MQKPVLKRPAMPKREVRDNTSVTLKANGNKEILKAGIPNDLHSKRKHEDTDRVGLNLGVTVNMGEFESLRIDAWYSSNVNDGETVEEAFIRIKSVVETVLDETAAEYNRQE